MVITFWAISVFFRGKVIFHFSVLDCSLVNVAAGPKLEAK